MLYLARVAYKLTAAILAGISFNKIYLQKKITNLRTKKNFRSLVDFRVRKLVNCFFDPVSNLVKFVVRFRKIFCGKWLVGQQISIFWSGLQNHFFRSAKLAVRRLGTAYFKFEFFYFLEKEILCFSISIGIE